MSHKHPDHLELNHQGLTARFPKGPAGSEGWELTEAPTSAGQKAGAKNTEDKAGGRRPVDSRTGNWKEAVALSYRTEADVE